MVWAGLGLKVVAGLENEIICHKSLLIDSEGALGLCHSRYLSHLGTKLGES